MRRLVAALVIVVCLYARPVVAQPPAAPPPAREGSAELAFVGTSGNSPTQTFGVGGELILRPDPWESRFRVAYVRNESEDELKAEATVLLLRVQRKLRPRLSTYGQYAYQRDRFAGIENRNAVEGGIAYAVIDQARQKLVADAGLGYINEQHLAPPDTSAATFGTGGLYTLKISDTTDLSEEAKFLFSFDNADDWRYANVLAVTSKINAIFSLKVSNTLRYLNLPVAAFKSTDTITSIALVAKF